MGDVIDLSALFDAARPERLCEFDRDALDRLWSAVLDGDPEPD